MKKSDLPHFDDCAPRRGRLSSGWSLVEHYAAHRAPHASHAPSRDVLIEEYSDTVFASLFQAGALSLRRVLVRRI